MEVMLSLIEFCQFQRSVYEFACDDEDEHNSTFDFFLYPSFVPNSSIVFDELEAEEIALCHHLGLQNLSHSEEEGITDRLKMEQTANEIEIAIKKIEYLMRAHKLYAKYIQNGAELQINLTKETRNVLVDAMDGFDQWVNAKDVNGDQMLMLFKLFEKAMEEMYTLLNYSFSRFKCSKVDYAVRSRFSF